jgi:glycosyltransferase involved in cell wall biosynthesis
MLVVFASFFIPKRIKTCLYEPSMPSAQFQEKHLPQYYRWLMKVFYRFSDYIIAQTEDMKNEIEQYYSKPKEKIIVTINPIDTALIAKQVTNAKNPYNSKYINIIISGRISDEKGQVFLLKSFAKIVKNNPKYKLHILGNVSNQTYMKQVEKIITENNLQNNVEFMSFKLNPFPYYKFADLLVLSSKWEGLPNVVLEALYLQTPVVVTDCIPYFYKLIHEGKNGYVVKYGDEDDMADKIQKFHNLNVEKDFLNLPNYNKIFWEMIHN